MTIPPVHDESTTTSSVGGDEFVELGSSGDAQDEPGTISYDSSDALPQRAGTWKRDT